MIVTWQNIKWWVISFHFVELVGEHMVPTKFDILGGEKY